MSRLRRWRDRKRKIVHAYDPDQDTTFLNVTTLCGECVWHDRKTSFGSVYEKCEFIPPADRITPEFPKPSTKLTCMSCIALTW